MIDFSVFHKEEAERVAHLPIKEIAREGIRAVQRILQEIEPNTKEWEHAQETMYFLAQVLSR